MITSNEMLIFLNEGKNIAKIIIHKFLFNTQLPEANFLRKVVHEEILKGKIDQSFIKKNRIAKISFVDENLDKYIEDTYNININDLKKDIIKIYEKNQKKLKKEFPEKIKLYRGSQSKIDDTISFWTTKESVAKTFGGIVSMILTCYKINKEMVKEHEEYLVISK